jgi:hypothetical protein
MKTLEQKIKKDAYKPSKLKNLITIVAITASAYGALKISPLIPNLFHNPFEKDYQIYQISQEIGKTPYNLSNPENFNSFQTKYDGIEYTLRLNGDGLSYSRIEIIEQKKNMLISSYSIEGQNAVGIIPIEESLLETKTNNSNGIYFEVLQKDPNNPFSNQFVKTIYFAKF